MNTLEFLRAIWPTEGWYCLVIFHEDNIRHFWYDTIEGAASAATKFDERGITVYFACATYKEKGSRKAANVLAVGAIWLDLDVGTGPNKFSTMEVAADSTKQFIARHNLPKPLIVASGGGFHAYWAFGCNVAAVRAKKVAQGIKAIAAAENFTIDPTRTADLASILRPVGTHNYKYTPARQVLAVTEFSPVDFSAFAKAVAEQTKSKTQVRKTNTPNRDFLATIQANANLVADRCAQIKEFRNLKGNISEPQWYSGIEVLYHCANGEELIHAWSQGHPDYDAEQTDAKIAQIKTLGPTTCATFEARNPAGCAGCPHKGKITSPIQLGTEYEAISGEPVPREVPDRVADRRHVEAVTFVEAPAPFKRTAAGVVFTNDDGIDVPVHPYDLYVSDIAYDPFLGYAVATLRHLLPQDGWQEFAFRCSDVSSLKEFEKTMRDNHVMPRNPKLLLSYITYYMEAVQRERHTRTLFNTMGWNGDDCIVLGERAYYSDGHEESAGLSAPLKLLSPAFVPKGELEPWIEATAILGESGMEAHAFMFCAGAGALLMRFSGFEATMFNAVGESNSGKTSMGRFLTSMYGDYNQLKLKKDDTENAKIARIALLGSLPTYIEEVTNEESDRVSDFCYEVTQGRSKLRLRIDGSEREVRKWNTIVVSSSNTSLSAKLGLAKTNPEAERLRLFEFSIERTACFEGASADRTFRTLDANFGHSGIAYVKYLVTHQEEIARLLTEVTTQVGKAASARPEERMWVAAVSCCVAGAIIMDKLKLVRFDVKRVAQWAVRQIKLARAELMEGHVIPVEVLGYYLAENTSSMLVVRENGMTASGMSYHEDLRPSRELHIRFDATLNRAWVDQQHFRRWCTEHHENFKQIKRTLTEEGIILGVPRRTLGKGTNYAGGAILAVEIDMEHPSMGNVIVRPVPKPMKNARLIDLPPRG